MWESIQQVRNQLNGYWNDLDKGKRKKVIIAGVISLLVVIILVFLLTRTEYDVLFTNLSLKDMAEVKDKLDELGIKYRIPDNNPRTILVPENMKNLAKIELASEGLPKSGYSFLDAFNDSSWTMTDYDKKERMKLALQSELASTISEIDGIDKATVYINEKDETGFVLNENDNKTTASVFIEKSYGSTLSSGTIKAIQNLVASSINTSPEEVQIIDSEGNLLTNSQGESELMMTDQFVIKSNLENKINESIKRFLENIFGKGNVDVLSSVKINFNSEKTTIVEFKPPVEGNDEGLIRSMEEVEEHVARGSGQGTPGTEGNIRNYEMANDSNEVSNKRSSIINYELNQINQEILKAPGQVEDITVAVLINRDVLLNGNFNADVEKDVENLIYAATGLNTRQVVVMAGNFAPKDTEGVAAIESVPKMNLALPLAIGAVILMLLGIVLLRRRKRVYKELNEVGLRAEEEKAVTTEVEDLDIEAEKPKIRAQIDKFVERNPELVAQLLRTWLNE